jgi:hypothetical protein
MSEAEPIKRAKFNPPNQNAQHVPIIVVSSTPRIIFSLKFCSEISIDQTLGKYLLIRLRLYAMICSTILMIIRISLISDLSLQLQLCGLPPELQSVSFLL